MALLENSSTQLYSTFNVSDIENQEENAADSASLDEEDDLEFTERVFLSLTLTIIAVLILIGNILVIYTIIAAKLIKRPAYKLIVSLACTDLLLAITILPISIYNEIQMNIWDLRPEICQAWLMLDGLLSTCSIYHILIIAIDRYWAVSDVNYAKSRQTKMYILIASAWILATVVSSISSFAWADGNFYKRTTEDKECVEGSTAEEHLIFVLCMVFCIPLAFIVILHWIIFKRIRHMIQKKPGSLELSSNGTKAGSAGRSHMVAKTDCLPRNEVYLVDGKLFKIASLSTTEQENSNNTAPEETKEDRRERRAAKVLFIITVAFICCCCPYLIALVLTMICSNCVNEIVFGIVVWLQYVNSLLNPIIYTVFNPDFKNALKRILFPSRMGNSSNS